MSSSDETRLAADAPTVAAGATRGAHPPKAPSGNSGWLTSSGSIDHGRFPPGEILDGRYRILGLLGRGGMGEVYRADDLRLGQAVALKFLPENLGRDPVRLAQFHNEVRTARQVSHPNVCRMYDIGDIGGQLFLTMEYVDGEDLSSLLRRIGRLPEDKALEIARQVAAGLAAAHERGVLHRDLKPANIMLDGAGRVRIMDFSLAAVGEVTDIRAGTPAYMAPEQLEGLEVTARSDIYALGLVLYELFTGHRTFESKTIADLIAQHQSGTITAPTEFVKTLDPVVERAILRCLEHVPARRPASALAVSASLPGGDPLAAALAAGETPSPEMVAAAGGDTATMSMRAGALWLGVLAVSLIVTAALVGRGSILGMPPPKPPAVLIDRAEALRKSFGYTAAPADTASSFVYDQPYLNWAVRNGRGASHWAELAGGRPAPVRFWYRTSPLPLVPVNFSASPGLTDPPLLLHGMTTVVLDGAGQLLRFEAAPAQIEDQGAATTAAAGPMDWSPFFTAAALPREAFTDTPSTRAPAMYADERHAWKGLLPGTQIEVRIEAAAARGKAVLFEVVSPWTVPTREVAGHDDGQNGSAVMIYLLLAAAVIAARFNVKGGRADHRGAFRIGVFAAAVIAVAWLVDPHVLTVKDDQQRLFVRVGIGLFVGLAMYFVYLGLEPLVRRSWPTMLVGWSRALRGQLRDSMVGRDMLIGAALGAGLTVANLALGAVSYRWLGRPEPIPHQTDLATLNGTRAFLSLVVNCVNSGLQNAMITVFEFAAFRGLFEWLITRRLKLSPAAAERVFVALAVATMAMMAAINAATPDAALSNAAYEAISTTVILIVLLRIGLLAAIPMMTVNQLLLTAPLTLDGGRFYSTESWYALAVIVVLAVWGFREAVGTPGSLRAARPHALRS